MGWQRPLNGPSTRVARLAGVAIVGIVAAGAGTFLLLPLLIGWFVRGLELTVNACVWLAASLGAGVDAWTIASSVGRAAAAALVTPRALGIIAGLVLIGAVALYGLQRLLGYEEESSR
jgi:hypothetical protein